MTIFWKMIEAWHARVGFTGYLVVEFRGPVLRNGVEKFWVRANGTNWFPGSTRDEALAVCARWCAKDEVKK